MKIRFLYSIFFSIIAVVVYISLNAYSNSNGNKIHTNSQEGCTCHGNANLNTQINVIGLPSPNQGYTLGQTYPIQVVVSNNSMQKVGINLSVNQGKISNLSAGLTLNSDTSFSHTSPINLVNGTSIFTFMWTAPMTHSNELNLFASANAVNNNANSIGDQWNKYSLNLPLNIPTLEFGASTLPNHVRLMWHTNSENKIKYYIIEKSIDGIVFDSIYMRPATGGFNVPRDYDHFDYPQYSGEYFYRIKAIDADFNIACSPIIKVNFDNGAKFEVLNFPNPSILNTEIFLNIFNNKSKTIATSLIDVRGNVVFIRNFDAIKGTNYFSIPNSFAPGYYNINIKPEDGPVYNLKQLIH